ncbi:MAG TPA: nitroreductase family deazaflavin-dependent oxidoreductase [Solirubrobacteraceae bacterium]|jgi:deazaflavin-dependent oxidoreductase (nitroreductase family)|nr:nitroreductase family deazaflavin-dependent oxidoreductase [Solirubrobacteraceae bacterium]
MSDFQTQVIDDFRAGGGKVGGMFEGMDMLLLHHVGARSGQQRVAPLAYLKDGERYAIFASKAGAPTNPAWYHNLKANPETTIEVGTETVKVTATEPDRAERDRIFTAMGERRPQFAEYQTKTTRVIPVILLTPA